jgi:hypothetical protein
MEVLEERLFCVYFISPPPYSLARLCLSNDNWLIKNLHEVIVALYLELWTATARYIVYLNGDIIILKALFL